MSNKEIASIIMFLASGIELDVKHSEMYPNDTELFKKFIMQDVEKLKEIADKLKTE